MPGWAEGPGGGMLAGLIADAFARTGGHPTTHENEDGNA